MQAKVSWRQDRQYDGESGSGHHLVMDGDPAHQAGASPMELVLIALCGCSSMDVVSILSKKREPFTSLTVTAEAEQAPEHPRTFTHIRLTYHLNGKISPKAAEDAVALSSNKYCSVSKMLEKSATIDHVITFGDDTGTTA